MEPMVKRGAGEAPFERRPAVEKFGLYEPVVERGVDGALSY